jgi:hypothetical protein
MSVSSDSSAVRYTGGSSASSSLRSDERTGSAGAWVAFFAARARSEACAVVIAARCGSGCSLPACFTQAS